MRGVEGGIERGRDGETAVERRDRERGKDGRVRVKWVFIFGVVAAFGRIFVGGADFGGPNLAVLPTCGVCVYVCVYVCARARVCVCVRACVCLLVSTFSKFFSSQL